MRSVRIAAASLVALVLMVPTLGRLTTDAVALGLGAATIAAVLGAGIVLRLLRAPEWATSILQAVLVIGGAALAVGLFGEGFQPAQLGALVRDGVEHLQDSVAPVPPNGGLTVLLVSALGLLALVTDTFVVGPQRPAAIVGPQLAIFVVPSFGAAAVPAGIGTLAYFAIGLVLVLFAGSDVTRDRGRHALARRAGATGTVALVALVGIVLTALLAAVVDVPESRGRTNDPIQMTDPSLDLKRNLVQGGNRVAFTYTTDQPDGAYLRMTSLPAFDASGFHLANSTVRTGPLPGAPGLDQEGTPRQTTITIAELRSEWLPAPYAPVRVRAGDGWGHLEDLSILALNIPERQQATTGMTYDVASLDVAPGPDQLAAASGNTPPDDVARTGEVPGDIPPRIIRLTEEVTAGQTTSAGKAQAILQHLRGPQFRYSLRPAPGTGYQTLERFLLEDHVGYCEQYAASMALMARIAGIPARVAVGFTAGTRADDGTYEVRMDDMHTWPELWIDGWGWVAYEPTPSFGGGPGAEEQPAPETTATPEPAEPTVEPTPEPAEDTGEEETDPQAEPIGGGLWSWLGPALAGLAVVAVLVLAPGAVRAAQRRRRLAGGRDPATEALDAWDEVRATLLDHRLDLPTGSPRFAAARLGEELALEASGEELGRLALAAELALYAPAGTLELGRDWHDAVAQVEAASRRDLRGWALVRAKLFPASLWQAR